MAANPAAFLFAQTDWRAQLVKLYDAEARRLQAAYQRTLRRLELEHGQLAAAIAELERTGQLTAQAVRDLPATGRLMRAISTELDGFARYLDGELAGLSDDALRLGAQAAESMTLTAAGNATGIVQAAWRRPDPEMLARIVRYAESPAMRAGLARFGDAAAEGVLDTLLTLTAQGKGSRTIATALRNAYAVPYSYAENMARTAQAYSYRGASHASYRANSDVVQGWVWLATLDSRTCVSCISQHGTRHTNDETLNDHHRGRCLVPGELVKTARGLVPVEQVVVGDYVLTHRGNWKRVVRLYERDYSGNVVTVNSGGHRVTVTPEHPIYTARGWVQASDLSASDTFLTLVASDVRSSSLNTVQPNSIRRSSLRWSMGRLTGERCQRGSHSTANFTSGNAKSMLYDSSAICGTGDNPASFNAARNLYSPSDMWLRVCSRIIAVLTRASLRWPASINGLRKSGLRSICRLTAIRALIGSIPVSRNSFISDRVLMLASAHNSRYDASSATYLCRSHSSTGFPNLASRLSRHFAELRTPTTLGSVLIPSASRLCPTALNVLPIADPISASVNAPAFARMKLSSTSVQFLPAMMPSYANGSSIQHSLYAGKVYDLEVEEDHSFFAGGIAVHNCTAAPIVIGSRLFDGMQTGPEWFDAQPEAVQRKAMGPGMYDAYRRGAFQWSDVSVEYQDGVYGPMRRAATLRELTATP